MAKISINKPEAARRQLDAAIRLLFSGEDPVSIHTLAMAGLRILKDLASKQDVSNIQRIIDTIIKPDMKGELWRTIYNLANYLKHADRDPDKIHDGTKEEINDWVLCLGCMYYHDLGYKPTPEMCVLIAWLKVLNPDGLNFSTEKTDPQLIAEIEKCGDSLRSLRALPRKEQLAIGLEVLKLVRPGGHTS